MSKKRESTKITGVAWFSREQWHVLKEVATDKSSLHDTYDEWIVDFNSAISQLQQAGIESKPVPIDVVELVKWCSEQNLPIDGKARAKFAAKKLEESYKK